MSKSRESNEENPMSGLDYVLNKLDELEQEIAQEREARKEAEERVEELEALVGVHVGTTQDNVCAGICQHEGRISRLEETVDLGDYEESLSDDEKGRLERAHPRGGRGR